MPESSSESIVPQLITSGRVTRPTLGFEPFQDIVARRLRLRGVLINRVFENTGADAAGLRGTSEGRRGGIVLGDLITAIDSKPIDTTEDLRATLRDYAVGDTVEVTFRRDGDERRVPVVLGEAAMCTALGEGDGRWGMNAPGAEQNARFCLNVLHWLTGLLD